MKPRVRKFSPGVESLETVVLLSTATANLHLVHKQPAVVVVAPDATATTQVKIRGVIQGTGRFTGTTLNLKGSGNLGKLGATTLNVNASILNPPSTITLNTRKGKIVLAAASDSLISGNSGSVDYTITGGTKAYANATGSGLVAATYNLKANNTVAFKLRFA